MSLSRIKIVTDAVVNATQWSNDIVTVIDLPIIINGQVYSHISKISNAKYLSLLQRSSTSPEIGTVSVEELITLYDQLGADGSKILSLHLSDRFTDTYSVARQAAVQSLADVTVVNSGVPAAGLSYQIQTAVNLIQANASFATVIAQIRHTLENTRVYLSISDNSQLVAQHRISWFRAIVENRANVKYLMRFKDNDFQFIERTTNDDYVSDFWRNQIQKMHELNIASLDIIHTGDSHRAYLIYDLMDQEFPLMPIHLRTANPEMANYLGQNATGVTYLLG